ncbi:MAG: hypothetical protein ACMUHU_02950 [Thermoplasmatota archaeon]
MDVLAALEGVFVSRGYRVVRSSGENRYLLLGKGNTTMAVGYSSAAGSITEGEAEMFVSMGQNDSAGSMLFISPGKLSRSVKAVLEREGVATWDRSELASAIGEYMISLWSGEEEKQGARAGSREVETREVGGFRIREVDLGSRRVLEKVTEAVLKQEPPPAVAPAPPAVPDPGPVPEAKTPEPEPETYNLDMPLFMVEEAPEEKPPAPKAPITEKKREDPPDKTLRKVPEEILMDPWAGFEEHRAKQTEKKKGTEEKAETPDKLGSARTGNPWAGSTLAPLKYDAKEALSLAGVEEGAALRRENRPFLLLEASYSMLPEDGTDPVENDGTYLYDCLKGDVTDIPGSLFDEVANLPDRWDGREGPKTLTNLKDDHNSAVSVLRKKITEEKLARDRKVRETLMSTIYREIEYRFDPKSLKLISSRRVMLPYWVKDGKGGRAEWEVNAFLGTLAK